MSEVIKLVQGDSRPVLYLTLTDENTGDVIDITGADVEMKFRAAGSTTVLDTLAGGVLVGAAGTCTIPWGATTLDVDAGEYEGDVQVTFADNTIQSVYTKLRFRVRADF